MANEQPSLGQLIWLVRRELEWARQVDEDQPLHFDVGSVELDVAVEVTKTTSGGGGLDLTIMGVGGNANLSREAGLNTGTTVHVVLTPSDSRTSSGKLQVSALDTEPPPRRTSAAAWKAGEGPVRQPQSATDSEAS
jgi:hypothetical protein